MQKNFFKKMLHNVSWVFLTAIAASCGRSDLPDFNKVDKLRVLAIQSSAPEVDPGATVTMTPVISDINATSLTYTVQTCIDAGIGAGAEPTCDNNPTKQVLATNQNLTLPGLAESWTGAADTFAVTVPIDTIIFYGRSSEDKYNGVAFLVEYILTNNRQETLRTIKRIVVSESAKTAKNTNPSVTQVFSNGVAMTTLPLNTKINLSTDLAASAAESYLVKNRDGTQTSLSENVSVTWFITDGKTKFFRSEIAKTNEYTTPTENPTGRASYLIAVAKDDRGGLSFVKKKF